MKRDIERISLFPGAGEMLHRLAQNGIILGVATTSSQANVLRILTEENASYFQYFECGSSIFGKEAKVRRLLARTKVGAENTILVGDEIRDAALRAKLEAAASNADEGYPKNEYGGSSRMGILRTRRRIHAA